MRLDRNINGTGRGKYGLIKTRRLAEWENPITSRTPTEDFRRRAVLDAIEVLQLAGVLDWGPAGTESEFFVIKLRDEYAREALMAYGNAVEDDQQYADDIYELAQRAGDESPFCKKPD